MNIIDTIFPFYVVVICIFALLRMNNPFKDGIIIGILGIILGFAIGLGISVLFSAGVLWLIIGILSFFGVASVGTWTVGFSWTAVKMVMMVLFLIAHITK